MWYLPYQKCKIRFAEAGFNVRKWRSNDPNLKQIFSTNEVKLENFENGKVLCINWDVGDLFIIRFNECVIDENDEIVTKWLILKVMAGFYDPLGWIQPIVIKLKILFQEACKLKIGSDDLVPPDFNEIWQRTVSEIMSLKEIMISRCYCYSEISNPIVGIVMHGFSDASMSAYSGCVYLRFVKSNGDVKNNSSCFKVTSSTHKECPNRTTLGVDEKCYSSKINCIHY